MEENIIHRIDYNSVPFEKVLQPGIAYMDRKRKLLAEELGTPPPKHKWSSRGPAPEYTFPSNSDSDVEGVYRCINKVDLSGVSTADESEQESAKDSNSVATDADSAFSVSNETEIVADQGYFKEYLSDQPFNSSVDWGGSCSKHAVNSSESSLVRKSGSILESPSIGKEHDLLHHGTGLHLSMNYEEHILEFGGHVDCSCPECRANFGECTEKELEKRLYSNGVTSNNYVLSSGRWTPRKDTQQSTKKLTIDKEFEQFFSMLML